MTGPRSRLIPLGIPWPKALPTHRTPQLRNRFRLRGAPVHEDPVALPVRKGQLVPQAQPDPRVLWVFRARLGLKGHQVFKVPLGHQGHRDSPALKGLPAHRDQQGLREAMIFQFSTNNG